jgi:hypothetical protein
MVQILNGRFPTKRDYSNTRLVWYSNGHYMQIRDTGHPDTCRKLHQDWLIQAYFTMIYNSSDAMALYHLGERKETGSIFFLNIFWEKG